MKYLRYMLVFLPLAVLAEFVLHNELLIFLFSCLALIPLAGYLGEATEELAIHTGPRIGGLLNATLGNAAELIITIVALQKGEYELVKASITGSIFGNLLLILGASLLVGGLKNGVQHFDRSNAGVSATLMLLAVIGLLIPTMFELFKEIQVGKVDLFNTEVVDPSLNNLSLWVAGILMIMYILSLIFSFSTPERGVGQPVGGDDHNLESEQHTAKWSVPVAVGVLAASTLCIVFLSEFLVGAVGAVTTSLGLSALFIGIIVIPLVGNVAEHIVGVQVAYKNKMDLSLAISLGSSTQVALFVAPLLVFISALFFARELTLFFTLFEVIGLGAAVLAASFVAQDGESNWLEGALLLAIYAIFALGFFFLRV